MKHAFRLAPWLAESLYKLTEIQKFGFVGLSKLGTQHDGERAAWEIAFKPKPPLKWFRCTHPTWKPLPGRPHSNTSGCDPKSPYRLRASWLCVFGAFGLQGVVCCFSVFRFQALELLGFGVLLGSGKDISY